MADERVKVNERHRELYRQTQTMVNIYLKVINQHNQAIVDKDRAEGRTPRPKELYSPLWRISIK